MAEKRTVVCTFCLKSTRRHHSKHLLCGHFSCNECHGNSLQTGKGCPKCRKPIPLPRAGENDEYSDYTDVTVDSKQESFKYEGEVHRFKNFDRSCSIHGSVVDFFCYSCNLPACSQCLLTTHKIRDHDIASFVDFAKDTIKGNIKKLNDLKTLQTKLAGDISHSKMVIQKDGGKLKQLILEAYKDAEERMKKEKETLLDSLKRREDETVKLLSSLQNEHDIITSKLLSTTKTCLAVERDLSQSKDLKNQFNLESMDKTISEIEQKTERLSHVPLPEHLSLNFTAHRSDLFIGSLRDLLSDEDTYYSQLRELPTWTAEKEVDIGELNIDFSNIVCMSSDWVVYISSLDESQYVAIRHYSLDKRIVPRKPMDLPIGSYNWTAAKDSGQDHSILLASGQNVYRISFRKMDKEITKSFKLSFSAEAISWDENKVDCYILSNNLRDVHRLYMSDGTVSYLCSFQTRPQSVSSFTVNDDCKIQLLDRTTGNIHVTSYVTSDHGEKMSLQQLFPKSFESESMMLSPHSMVTRRDLGGSFVLFNQNGLLTVGSYNNKFGFLQWVIKESTNSEGNLVDMSIKDENLAVLFGTKIAIYKIKSDL